MDRLKEPQAAVGTAGGAPVQRDGERAAVKRYVLLGVLLQILDHDIRAVAVSGMKLPRFYASVLRGLQDRVLLEQAALRKSFRSAGLKILEQARTADGLSACYVCRGYQHRFTMLWSQVRAEAERTLRAYGAG